MYAWEGSLRDRVFAIRAQEMVLLRRLAITIALGFLFVLLVAPIIMPMLVFTTYIYTGDGSIKASTAFTTVIAS